MTDIYPGKRCHCGAPASHKVGEEFAAGDPRNQTHNLTADICRRHFRELMGPIVDMLPLPDTDAIRALAPVATEAMEPPGIPAVMEVRRIGAAFDREALVERVAEALTAFDARNMGHLRHPDVRERRGMDKGDDISAWMRDREKARARAALAAMGVGR